MTLGEGMIINGTGVQTTTNSRWGDYTSMNVDPVDDCTFWYVNEYYTAAGPGLQSPAGWQTRIASFKLPGCTRGSGRRGLGPRRPCPSFCSHADEPGPAPAHTAYCYGRRVLAAATDTAGAAHSCQPSIAPEGRTPEWKAKRGEEAATDTAGAAHSCQPSIAPEGRTPEWKAKRTRENTCRPSRPSG